MADNIIPNSNDGNIAQTTTMTSITETKQQSEANMGTDQTRYSSPQPIDHPVDVFDAKNNHRLALGLSIASILCALGATCGATGVYDSINVTDSLLLGVTLGVAAKVISRKGVSNRSDQTRVVNILANIGLLLNTLAILVGILLIVLLMIGLMTMTNNGSLRYI